VFETEIHPLRICPRGPVVYCLYVGNFEPIVSINPVEASFYGLRIHALESADVDLSVETVARQHVEALRPITPHGPYVLLGYSFGGLVAYEMAVQLQQSGEQIGLLGLLDTPHPGFHGTLSPEELEVARRVYRADRARKYWTNLKTGRIDRLARDALTLVGKKLRPLSWRMARVVHKALGRKRLTVSPEVRVDTMWRAYRPPQFDGHLLLIRAQGRDAEFACDPTMGWHKSALRGVDVKFASGSHESMMAAEHAMQLAAVLAPVISALAPKPP
jgi:acetoacetyl-CoA synthetase